MYPNIPKKFNILKLSRRSFVSGKTYQDASLGTWLNLLDPGEANAISIRIARAATGKDHIAICGYHGWHDWYLSVNLKGKIDFHNIYFLDFLHMGSESS